MFVRKLRTYGDLKFDSRFEQKPNYNFMPAGTYVSIINVS